MVSGSEIAKELGIPATTCRDYIRRFSTFFVGKRVAGSRWEMFPDNAVEIMQEIAKGYKTGLSGEEIREGLSKKYPQIYDGRRQVKNDDNETTAGGRSLVVTGGTSMDLVAEIMARQHETMNRLIETVVETQKQTVDLLAKMQAIMDKQNEAGKEVKGKVVQPRRKKPFRRRTVASAGKQNKSMKPILATDKPAVKKNWWGRLWE